MIRYHVFIKGLFNKRRGYWFDTKAAAEEFIATRVSEKMRPRWSIEERTVRDRDDSQRMTCQACGRAHMAKRGFIAHHGYQRPWQEGWQTASCAGAKHIPYEAGHALLDSMLVMLRNEIKRSKERLSEVEEGKPFVLVIQDITKPRNALGLRPSLRILLTNENFVSLRDQNAVSFRRVMVHTIDDARTRVKLEIRSKLAKIEYELGVQQKRRDNWKLTHAYDAETQQWNKLQK